MGQTIAAIDEVTKTIRNVHDVRRMIIVGDFNTEEDMRLMRGFEELKDKRYYHQHNLAAKKTRIDRIFTNFDDVGILDVYQSVEKKKRESLGQKVALLYVGKKPQFVKKTECKIQTAKNLKRVLKDKPIFDSSLTKNMELAQTRAEKIEILNDMAAEFTDTMTEYSERAAKVVTKRKLGQEHVLIQQINFSEDQKHCGSKDEKAFLRFNAQCKNKIQDNTDTSATPSAEKLCEKLNKKLKGLNKADLAKAKEIADEIYKGYKVQAHKEWSLNIRNFRRAVLSTSSSGARDCHGLSLKTTKVLLSNNTFLK